MPIKNRLKKIIIKGFQNHEYRTIKFNDVTAFVGGNDAGKSAILRALRFLFLNKPRGDGFINNDADKLIIKAYIDDHIIKVIKKRKGGNVYYLDGYKLKAAGAGKVPDKIADILNISDECFAKQHQKLFWFQDSPGQVSKELNKIVNLDVIDKILSNVNSDLRSKKSESKLVKHRLQSAKKQKAKLDWAVELNTKIEEIQQISNRIEKLDSEIKELDELVSEYKLNHRSITIAIFQINVFESAIEAGEKLINFDFEYDELEQLLSKYKRNKRIVGKQIPKLNRAKKLYKKIVRIDKQCEILNSIINEARSIERRNENLEVEIKKLETQKANIEIRFKKCRVCGSMIPR